MSVKVVHSLVQLTLSDKHSFYCLEEGPIRSSNRKAVIFLHGLGENRTGLNYLFHELSLGLRSLGYAVYRFDLAGCGESSLDFSINIWRDQLEAVKNLGQKYSQVHLISRGISRVLLSQSDKNINIAIGSISRALFYQQIPLIRLEEHPDKWIPSEEKKMSPETESFWSGLGVEAGCMGGFYLPKTFIEELKHCISLPQQKVEKIFSGKMPSVLSSQEHYLPNCHPLFFHMNDRKNLLNKIKEILEL